MDLHDAYRLARQLMDEHGLADWSLELDNAKRRAGVCRWDRRTIGLSAPLTRVHPAEEVRQTVLHEVAHALAGRGHGHDGVWAATVTSIGGRAERCVPADAPRVPAPWLGVCPAGHAKERHRRPERVESCGRCLPRFSADHLFQWTYRGRPARMHPNYESELEHLRQGRTPVRFVVGSRVRFTGPGDLGGSVGVVLRRGRTRYVVQFPGGAYTVPFGAVEPA